MTEIMKDKKSGVSSILWFIWLFGWLFTSGLALSTFEMVELTQKFMFKIIAVNVIAWPMMLGVIVAELIGIQ